MKTTIRLSAVATLALLLALTSAQASAETVPMLSKGTRDLSLEVSPDFEGVTGDTVTLNAGFGRFMRDRFELRLRAAYETIEDVAPGEKDYRSREIDIGCEYNFHRGGRLVPYAGFELGYRQLNYLDVKDSAAVYGPLGGLKYFLANNVAIEMSLAYKAAGSKVYVNDFQLEDSDLTYGFGLRVMF